MSNTDDKAESIPTTSEPDSLVRRCNKLEAMCWNDLPTEENTATLRKSVSGIVGEWGFPTASTD